MLKKCKIFVGLLATLPASAEPLSLRLSPWVSLDSKTKHDGAAMEMLVPVLIQNQQQLRVLVSMGESRWEQTRDADSNATQIQTIRGLQLLGGLGYQAPLHNSLRFYSAVVYGLSQGRWKVSGNTQGAWEQTYMDKIRGWHLVAQMGVEIPFTSVTALSLGARWSKDHFVSSGGNSFTERERLSQEDQNSLSLRKGREQSSNEWNKDFSTIALQLGLQVRI